MKIRRYLNRRLAVTKGLELRQGSRDKNGPVTETVTGPPFTMKTWASTSHPCLHHQALLAVLLLPEAAPLLPLQS